MEDERKKQPRVRVGGLWAQKGGVMSGTWGGLRIVIFPEREKKSEKSPDFAMWLEAQEPKPAGDKGGW